MNSTSGCVNAAFEPNDGGTDIVSGDPDDMCQYAITVRHAQIQYKDVLKALISGSAPTTNVILKDFNMTVKTGHIYALLGASGCGKTSILRAIVGQVRLTAGEIRVLGHKPNTPESGIPGTTVGYMPQDMCLIREFTIGESLYFYGKIAGMKSDEIEAKCDYLIKLLDLPEANRLVRTLSGGQQRRVSFSIALVSSPPILILDEPTVGVDPLLRESIWEHLTKIAETDRTTVVITTHYIEEAILAGTVGFMRRGRLMAEQSPGSLMQNLQCDSLEDVLLKLCLHQSPKESSSTSTDDTPGLSALIPVNECEASTSSTYVGIKVSSKQRIQVLTWKENLLLVRYIWSTLLIVLLPVFCTTLFCLTIGGDPKDLRVSIYNQEANCFSRGPLKLPNSFGDINRTSCDMPSLLSCRIIGALQSSASVTPIVSDSRNSAEDDVKRGRALAAMSFSKNFSSALMKRLLYRSLHDLDEEDIDMGTVQVVMDNSGQVLSVFLQEQLGLALKRVLSDLDDVCHNLKHAKDLPLQFKNPLYGGLGTYRDSSLPGIITSTVLMYPCAMTLCLMMVGKVEGTLERGLVAGLTMSELMISQFIASIIPSILITVGTISSAYIGFGQIMFGNYWTLFGMAIPLMLSGMLLGFIFAIFSASISVALLGTVGYWLTCLFLSGTVWPVEGAHHLVRPIIWYFPLTLPSEAVRHITLRGWTMDHTSLHQGLMSIGAWTLVYLALILRYLRSKR